MNVWEAVKLILRIAWEGVQGPHRVVRRILGDTDEARYADAGFYLTSTGWTGMSLLQFFRLDDTLARLSFVFGLVFIVLAFLVIVKKHKLEDDEG